MSICGQNFAVNMVRAGAVCVWLMAFVYVDKPYKVVELKGLFMAYCLAVFRK